MSAGELKDRHKLFNHDLLQLIEGGLQAYSPRFEPIDSQTVLDHASSTFYCTYPDWPGLENILFKIEDAEMLEFEDPEQVFDAKETLKCLIQSVKPEVESVFSALKEVGFTADPETWQPAVIEEFKKSDFHYIKQEFLEDKNIYVFNPSKEKRDFIGKLLQKIVKDNGFAAGSYSDLYKIYNAV